MNTAVLGLSAAGLAATAIGTALGTVDIARRIWAYRRAADESTEPRSWHDGLDSIQQAQASRSPTIISAQARRLLAEEQAARHATEARLAALFGTSVRQLLIGVALVLVGAALSGAADIVAAVRA